MTLKRFYIPLLLLSTLLTNHLMTSCSDDEPASYIEDEDTGMLSSIPQNVLSADMVFTLDYTDAEQLKCIVRSEEPISFKILNDVPFSISTETEDDLQYMTIKPKGNILKSSYILVIRATGEESGDYRTIIVVARNLKAMREEKTRASNEDVATARLKDTYGYYLGMGTMCFGEIGNKASEIMPYELLPLHTEYIWGQPLDEEKMFEIQGETYKSMMESWSFNIGVSFGGMGKVCRLAPNESWGTMSGSIDLGVAGSISTSEDNEYYMNFFTVRRGELKMVMSDIEKLPTAGETQAMQFLGYISSGFMEDVFANTQKLDTLTFYNKWGTDMVQQCVLGGYNAYFYWREQNTYENKISADVNVKLKAKKSYTPDKRGSWWNIYKDNNSPNVGGEMDISYATDEYFSASKSSDFSLIKGGEPSVGKDDADTWLKGFSDMENSGKWQPIDYRTSQDNALANDSVWLLYPVENMASNVIDAVETIIKSYNPSKVDLDIIARARKNILSLAKYRKVYIEDHLKKTNPATRLVLCDVMMKNDNNRRKHGQPKPFTAKDPRDPSKYRTYYPMMANNYFDRLHRDQCDHRGKAIDTNDDCFQLSSHSSSHYWYYCLAHENDCEGIVDIKFLHKTEDYYVPRGSKASEKSGLWNFGTQVCVRYFDKNNKNAKSTDKITAFGIYDAYEKQIIASTGGSELRIDATESELQQWKSFWDSYKKHDEDDHKRFYDGGGANPHFIFPCFSTKDLPIKRINEVQHPATW